MKTIAPLCLVLVSYLTTAQQSTIKGIVSIHNSETLTGKRQYVSNAQVEDEFGKATPQVTNNQGQFQLIFTNQSEKSSVSFSVTKAGLQVVNQTALSAIAGQQEMVRISMASPDSINEYRRRIYNVGKTEGEKRLENLLKTKNSQLVELKKNSTQNAARIKLLEADLAKLEQEGDGLEQQAKELARKYAPINLDDATELMQNAFRLFQNGAVDSAAQLLQQADLEQRVNSLLEERKKITTLKAEMIQREKKAQQAATGYTDALQLKAALHKLRYEFDSVSACYELMIKLDTTNGDFRLEYAFFWEWLNEYDKAIEQTQKALVTNRQLAKTDPARYEQEAAKTLNRLGVYYTDVSDYIKAEAAYKEALAIRRKLVKQAPSVHEPDLAQTQVFLAHLYWNEEEYSRAEELLLEALKIYERLVQMNASQYEADLAKMLNILGLVYNDTKRFTQSEAVLLRTLEIRKRIAGESHLSTDEAEEAMVQDDLGGMYRNKKEYTKSGIAFERALTIRLRLAAENPQSYEPVLADTYNNSAGLFWDRKDYTKAIDNYNKALQIFTKRAEVHPEAYQKYVLSTMTNLGQIYIEMKNHAIAQKTLNEALAIVEKWVLIYPEAYTLQYIDVVSNLNRLYLVLPDSLLHEASKDDKIKLLEKHLYHLANTYPVIAKHLPGYWGNMAWYACTAGDFANAENYALKALRSDSTQVWVQINLAHALLFQKKYEAAQKQYQKIKLLKDVDGKSFAAICLEDLDALEGMGITNNYVPKIKAMLKK